MAEPVTTHWLIALGSNAADALQRLEWARTAIGALGELRRTSRPKRGADVVGRGPPYLNQLLELASTHDIDALRLALRRIETDLGRERADAAACAIDLDLMARIDAGVLHFTNDKPLAIPAIREALRDWGIEA